VVVVASLGFGEERGDGGKLIDVEEGPDGGWTRRSLMRWLWKRLRAAPASELFSDCSQGGGSGSGRHSVTRRGPTKRTTRQRDTRSMAARGGNSDGH
jgi:hypothetical protein